MSQMSESRGHGHKRHLHKLGQAAEAVRLPGCPLR